MKPMRSIKRFSMPAQAAPARSGELGSAHIDMLFNMILIISIFYVILSTIQLTLADVSARNGNRLALQTFQVVYDRRTFPHELQGSSAQSPLTRSQDPNIIKARRDATEAATLTGGTVFASGVLGAQGGFQRLGSYNYRGATFNAGAWNNCSASQQDAQVNFVIENQAGDYHLIRTSIRSEYPWRLGPIAICLSNTGTVVGRSN